MKKNILDATARAAMLARLAQLRADSPALWGKMNASQCACHLADQLRIAFGEIKVAGTPPFIGRTLVKTLVLWGMPAPKGKVQTMPEIDQLSAGTKPTTMEADQKTLLALIDRLLAIDPNFDFQVHPNFGRFTKAQWGRMVWIHMNHHLSQFGC